MTDAERLTGVYRTIFGALTTEEQMLFCSSIVAWADDDSKVAWLDELRAHFPDLHRRFLAVRVRPENNGSGRERASGGAGMDVIDRG